MLNYSYLCSIFDNSFFIYIIVIGIIILAIVTIRALKQVKKDLKRATNETKAKFIDEILAMAKRKSDFPELTSKDKDIITAFGKYNTSPQTAEEWFCLGFTAFNYKQYGEAINCYEKAIDLNPDYALSYYSVGAVYGALGDEKKTIICYKEAARLGFEPAKKWLCDNNVVREEESEEQTKN